MARETTDQVSQKAILMAAFAIGVDADECLEVGPDILPILWGLIGYQDIQKDKSVEALRRHRVLALGVEHPALAGQINRLAADILVQPSWQVWSMSNAELQRQFAMDSELDDVYDQLKDKKTLTKLSSWLFISKVVGMRAIPPLALYFETWAKAESGFAAKFKAEMDRREKDGLFPDPFTALGASRK